MLRHISSEVLCLVGLLFATHPIHTDAVSSMNNRTEMLSGTFVMLSFLTYASAFKPNDRIHVSYARIVVSVLWAIVAMLCKEQGITVVAINCAYDFSVVCELDAVTFLTSLLGADKAKIDDQPATKPKTTGREAQPEAAKEGVPLYIQALLKRVALALTITAIVMFFRLRVDFAVTHDIQTNRMWHSTYFAVQGCYASIFQLQTT